MIKGQVIGGAIGKVLARQKSGSEIELGELLVGDAGSARILMQCFDLEYGSQMSRQTLELASGMKLEENSSLEFFEPELRNYTLAMLKPLLAIHEKNAALCKSLPDFFSEIREVEAGDLMFLSKPEKALHLGKLRSGRKNMGVDVFLKGDDVLSHHVLVCGTTGRGKSVLVSNIIWGIMQQDYCGMLVLDPHDEYYGRNKLGMKDHPRREKAVYYTSNNAPPGSRSLKISLGSLKPQHFSGVIDFSDAQTQAVYSYYKQYGSKWIESLVLNKPIDIPGFHEGTIAVTRRKIMSALDLKLRENELFCNGIFSINSGENTISDICNDLEAARTVIVDTSHFSGAVELLIGSMVAGEIFSKYRHYSMLGELKDKPVISIVLEEAPRVLGKDILERGQNIYSTLAREGRKFRIGLLAITQLPSMIPRDILANMNTKIILGIEMAQERQAIIESASQDLSEDSRNIASLDKGEAIVTSTFSRFATPISVPFFPEEAKMEILEARKKGTGDARNNFIGMKGR